MSSIKLKVLISCLVVAFLTMGCAAVPKSHNSQSLTAMVLPVTNSPNAEPRYLSNLVSQVENSLRSLLRKRGVNVMSKHQLAGSSKGGNYDVSHSLSIQQWLRVMDGATQSVEFSDLRIAVFFELYPHLVKNNAGQDLIVEMVGELHDLHSGRMMCEFAALGDDAALIPIGADCARKENSDRCVARIARGPVSTWAAQVAEKILSCIKKS